MSSNIRIKRTATPGEVPSGLALGELAMNTADGMLYMKNDAGVTAGVSLTNSWGTSGTDIYYSSGNVGIGTSAPAQKLSVVGGILEVTSTNTAYLNPNYASQGVALQNASNVPTILTVNNTERMRIDSSGRVGIGTSSPSERLHVSGGDILITGTIPEIFFRSPDGSSNQYYIGANISDSVDGGFVIGEGSGINTGTARVSINHLGFVGIGTTSPNWTLDVSGHIGLTENNAFIWHDGNGNKTADIYASSVENIIFRRGASSTESMRIDSSGRLLVGTSSNQQIGDTSIAGFQLSGAGNASKMGIANYGTSDSDAATINLGKSKSGTPGTPGTIVGSNSIFGTINFAGDDGTDIGSVGASIQGRVDGTPGANDMPGRLVFSTTADGAATPTERMRIDSSGNVGIGTTSPSASLDVYTTAISGTSSKEVARFTCNTSGGVRGISISAPGDTNAFGKIAMEGTNYPLEFWTGTTSENRMTITAGGNVGINTTAPTYFGSNYRTLELVGGTQAGVFRSSNTTAGGVIVDFYGSGSWGGVLRTATNHPLTFHTNSTERMRIDSSGRLLVGTTSAPSTSPASLALLTISDNTTSQNIGYLNLQNTATILTNYGLGRILFSGNGTNGYPGAFIAGTADANWGASSYPTRLTFSTTANGASSPTERMRIDSSGDVTIAGNLVYDRGDIATQAEAEAGTNNTQVMTPLRVAQAIAALAGGGSVINSIQRFSGFWSSGSTLNVTISSVNTSKTMLSYLGSWGNYTYLSYVTTRVALTSATNVQLSRLVGATYQTYYSFEVIEFA